MSDNLITTDLFVSGEGGYHTYRIPALIGTINGTMLAFCEGRKAGGGDAGYIDLLVRRSTDGGVTWGEPIQVYSDPPHTVGNPAPIVDQDTGRIFLLFCHNRGDGGEASICTGEAQRTVWITFSDDDGCSWAKPREITNEVKDPAWTWYATGPCHGIQMTSGRMVISCDHVAGVSSDRKNYLYRSHVIYSDDHGKTWCIGGVLPAGSNESTIVETANSVLYINCRDQSKSGYRIYGFSHDQGATFTETGRDHALIDPVCQGSLIRLSTADLGEKSPVLFANIASANKREKLTIRLSYDECLTWNEGKVLHTGPAAYSDLSITPDGRIACFYENGLEKPYERLTLAIFPLEWLSAK